MNITVNKTSDGIRPDLFCWPQEDKNIWARDAYPEGRFTNHNLIKVFKNINEGRNYSLLDIGCGNGLFVLDVIKAGNIGVGIDGCHFYKDYPGFLWSEFPDNAILVDASEAYEIYNNKVLLQFDFITSWEHLEHIEEEQVNGWLANVKAHSHKNTKYIFSVSHRVTGSHICVKEENWWAKKFQDCGLHPDDKFKQAVNNNYVRHCHDSYYFHLSNGQCL